MRKKDESRSGGFIDRPFTVGYALLWMVSVACFSGSLSLNLMGPVTGQDAAGNPSLLFAAALVSTALGHLVWGLVLTWAKPNRQTFNLLVWVGAVIASLSVLLSALVPAGSGIGLAVLCGVLAGVSLSFLDVAWLQIAGLLKPRVISVSMPAAIAVGCVGALVLAVIDGAARPLALLLAVAMPLASCAAWTKGSKSTNNGEEANKQQVWPSGRKEWAAGAWQVIAIMWRPLLASLVLYLVFGFSLNVVGYAASALGDSMAPVGIASLVCEALAVGVMAARAEAHERVSVGATYATALVLFVLGVCLLPIAVQLVNPLSALFVAAVPIGVGGTICDALILGMVAHSSYDYHVPGSVVCGFVRGAILVVSACGALIGNTLVTGGYVEQHLGVTVFAQAAIVLMVVSAALFLGRRRIAVMLDDAHPEGVQASEVLAPNPADAGARHAAGAATGEEPTEEARATVVIDAGDGPDIPQWISLSEVEENADETGNSLDRAIDSVAIRYDLTPREREVFSLMAHGRSMPYMAQTLVLSESTVHSHVQRVYRKLGVHNRQDLIDLVESAGQAQRDSERQ